MFEKSKKTEETVIDNSELNTADDNGFSEDHKKYNSPQRKKKQAALSKKQRTVISVISCVLVVLLLFTGSMFLFPAFYFANATAITVNGTKVPVYEYNFNYWTTVQIFEQTYGDYLEDDVFDLSKSLASQQCPSSYSGKENMSWQDYFIEQTDTRLESLIYAYNKAVEMGFGLTASDQSSIDSFFEKTVKTNAEENKISEEEFIHWMFGTSCNHENLRTALEHYYIADHYNEHVLNSYTVEQTELDNWMTEYKDQFWGACYNYYGFKAASDSETDIAAAKKKAHDFLANVTDQASFATAALAAAPEADKEKFKSEAATLRYYFTSDEVSDSDISNWLFDESRQVGDTEVIYSTNDSTAYALYFVDADYPPTKASNLYSIYLGIGDKYADKNAAQAAAQAVQAKFIEGGKTVDVFKALAKEYSDSPTAAEDGGLNENFLPKNMDQELAIWCYTTGRAPGEYAIIESSYGGYYFVFLESYGDFVWRATAINDIKNYHYRLSQGESLSNIKTESTFLKTFMLTR